jgi:hypothetical protein
MFKKASKNICTTTVLASPNPFSPTPTSSAMKTPETQKMTLNQQMKKISKWNTPLLSCIAQAAITKNHLISLGQYT